MSSVNKVIAIGNLGSKPEMKALPSGATVANFSIACNEKFKTKDGTSQERTEWIRCVLFGKTAELAVQYLDKGRQVYIEGRLQTRTWDDKKSGEKKYATEVVVSQLTFLGNKGDASAAPSDNAQPSDSDEMPF